MAGPGISVQVTGLDKLLARLRREPRDIAQATAAALYVEAEQTIAEAKELTPVDTGALRSSGHVQVPEITDRGVTVALGFGGVAGGGNDGVGYAVYVHENLTAHHPVGQAKFLEVPVNKRRTGFADRLVARVSRRLGGG